MKYEATGIIHAITQTKEYGSSGFKKRELVLEIDDGKYQQLVPFEVTGDKVSMLDEYESGQTVRVDFNLRGREWKKDGQDVRYFGSLNAWRVEDIGGSTNVPAGEDIDGSVNGDEIPF